MDNLFKRILSLVLAVLMVVSYIPTSAFATDGADETPADVEPYDLGEDDTPIDTGYRYAYTEGSEVYDEYIPDGLNCCDDMLLHVEFYGATCTHADQILITCEYCEWMRLAQDIPGGEPKWEGHRYTDTVYDPTCQESGYTDRCCDGCGTGYQDNYVDPVDCSYGEDGLCIWCHTGECKHEGKCDPVEGGDYLAPTCGEAGYQTVKCQDCGKEFVKTLPATGNHDYDLETVYCKNCGVEFTCECDGDTKCTESSKDSNCYVCWLSHENCTVEESTGGDDGGDEGPVFSAEEQAFRDLFTKSGTVTLENGTNYNDLITQTPIIIEEGVQIVLDLNNQGIRVNADGPMPTIAVMEGAKLTIVDNSNDGFGCVAGLYNEGTMIINGGGAACGVFHLEQGVTRYPAVMNFSGDLEINGGYFSLGYMPEGMEPMPDMVVQQYMGNITITGGTFTMQDTAIVNSIAEGYELVENEFGEFNVVKTQGGTTGGDDGGEVTPEFSEEEFRARFAESGRVDLLETDPNPIVITGGPIIIQPNVTITLNLNGKSIRTDSDGMMPAFAVCSGASLTVENGAPHGYITGIQNEGTLTINGGSVITRTFPNANSGYTMQPAIMNVNGGKLIITGGSFGLGAMPENMPEPPANATMLITGNSSDISISGGLFTRNENNVVNGLTDGYVLVKNQFGEYNVAAASTVTGEACPNNESGHILVGVTARPTCVDQPNVELMCRNCGYKTTGTLAAVPGLHNIMDYDGECRNGCGKKDDTPYYEELFLAGGKVSFSEGMILTKTLVIDKTVSVDIRNGSVGCINGTAFRIADGGVMILTGSNTDPNGNEVACVTGLQVDEGGILVHKSGKFNGFNVGSPNFFNVVNNGTIYTGDSTLMQRADSTGEVIQDMTDAPAAATVEYCPSEKNNHQHVPGNLMKQLPYQLPTCTEDGYGALACIFGCGYYAENVILGAPGHKFDENNKCTACGEIHGQPSADHCPNGPENVHKLVGDGVFPCCIDQTDVALKCQYGCGYTTTGTLAANGLHTFENGACKFCEAPDMTDTYQAVINAGGTVEISGHWQLSKTLEVSGKVKLVFADGFVSAVSGHAFKVKNGGTLIIEGYNRDQDDNYISVLSGVEIEQGGIMVHKEGKLNVIGGPVGNGGYCVLNNGTLYTDKAPNPVIVIGDGEVRPYAEYVETPDAPVVSTVAVIGEEEYTSVQAAIDAADPGETIKLVADVTLEEDDFADASAGLRVDTDDVITLDLNDHYIVSRYAQTAAFSLLRNEGTLTITNTGPNGWGALAYTDLDNGGEYISNTISNYGTLNIVNALVNNMSSETVALNGYPHAIDNNTSWGNSAKLTITGGNVACSSYSAIRMFCANNSKQNEVSISGNVWVIGAIDVQNASATLAQGKLTITGGNFELGSSKYNIRFANWNGGATAYGPTAEITGGTFEGGITSQFVPAAANWNSKVVSGGTFGANVTAYVADGYAQLPNGSIAEAEQAPQEDVYVAPEVNVPQFVPAEVQNQQTAKNAKDDIKNNTAVNVTPAELESEKNKEAVEAAKEELNVPEDAYVEITVKVELSNIKAEVAEDETEKVTNLTFDVTPVIAYAGETAKIEVAEAITFRLPIPSNFAADYVDVYHYDEENVKELIGAALKILGQGANRYVEVSHDEFSPIEVVATETPEEPTVVEVDTLDELIAALASDSDLPILVTKTIEIPAGETEELDLNGKQITAAFAEGSATNHLYVFTNRGTLTIKDTVGGGVINTRGIFNYGNLTLASGTINAIDANGGHGVRTYANGTFTMNGGTVAATYEDGDPAVSGNYDATPITIDEGATVSITGGKITNASNYTPAINNAGELVIENVEVKAVFEAVASYGTLTIKGGSYEVTDPIGGHAVWIAAGTANIEGGTFTPDTGKQATSYGVCASDGTVSITGGIFHANAYGKILYTANDGEIKVSGGTFDVNPKDFVVDGFKPVENADGTYGVQVAKTYVAEVNGQGYETLAEAVAIGGEVKVLTDIALADPITVSKDVTLDLNGKVISGVNNTGSGALIKVANSGKLTVKDSSAEQTGKITYAQGTSNVGWTVYVEGELVLESGTIELTGSWSIGYAVDVRPNAWGSNYANPTVFTMNGGKLISSDGAVRVASTSYDSWSNISASFEMNAGKIEAAGDGVFIQQSNAAYDTLSFTLNGGNIEAAKYPVRVYGPAPTEAEDCMTIALNGGQLVGGNQGTNAALMDGKVYMGGGMNAETLLANGSVAASAVFAQANTMEGYGWKKTGSTYTLMEIVAPNAVVENLGSMTLEAGAYDIFDGSLKESTEDLPLQIALNFKTEDTLEDAKASYYGKWRTDFYLTFNGLADGATQFDVGSSYLAGNYGEFGWIAVPASYMAQTLETGVEYPVVSGYDSNITYEQICESVKNFTAAIYIDPAILAANPDFTVTLNLKMVNPEDDTDVLTIGEGFTFGFEDLVPPAAPNATVTRMDPMTLTAADEYMVWPNGDDTIDRPLQAVVNFQANETEEEIKGTYYEKWLVDFNLEFDGLANGTITADDCYLAGNYGSFGWIVIPTDGLELAEDTKYPVVSAYDATLNYKDICKSVKNFTAAIHVAPAILEANPDFTVTLTLVMTDPENANKTLTIGDPIIFTAEQLLAYQGEKYVAQIGEEKFTTLAAAVANAQADDEILLLDDITLTETVVIDKPVSILSGTEEGAGVYTVTAVNCTAFEFQTSGGIFNMNIAVEKNENAGAAPIYGVNVTRADAAVFLAADITGDADVGVNMVSNGTFTATEETLSNLQIYSKIEAVKAINIAIAGSRANIAGEVALNANSADGVLTVNAKDVVVYLFGVQLNNADTSSKAFTVNGDNVIINAHVQNAWSLVQTGAVARIADSYYSSIADAVAAGNMIMHVDLLSSMGEFTVDHEIIIYKNGHSAEVKAANYYHVDAEHEINGRAAYGVFLNNPEAKVTDLTAEEMVDAPDLTFAKKFTAVVPEDENVVDALMEKFGSYYADYELTITGMTSDKVVFNAEGTADGYLAGSFDNFNNGAWLQVPFADVEIKNGKTFKIMEYAAELMGNPDLKITCSDVFTMVQEFRCGVFFDADFLAANPDMKVNLSLKMYDPEDPNHIIEVGSYDFTAPTVVAKIGDVGYPTLDAAIEDAAQNDTIVLLDHIDLDENKPNLAEKKLTLDLNGKTLFGSVVGTVSVNGGIWRLSDVNCLVVPKGAEVDATYVGFESDDGSLNYNAKSEITLVSGNFEMTQNMYDWRIVAIEKNAAVNIADGISLTINKQAVYEGTLTQSETGKIVLANADSTLTTTNDKLNVTTDLADKKVEYKDGKYQVAAAVYININNDNMTLGNSLAINFLVEKDQLIEGVDYVAVITRYYSDDRETETIEIPISECDITTDSAGTVYYKVPYDKFAAKEMTDEVSIRLEVDGEVVSNTFTDTIQAYAMWSMNYFKQFASYREYITAMVDMLNYGAAAQIAFGYNTNELADSELTDELKAYATQSVTMEDHWVNPDGNAYVSNLALVNNIVLQMWFTGITEDMYAKVSYIDHNEKQVNADVAFDEFIWNEYYKMYGVPVDEIVIADGVCVVTITVYNGDGSVYSTVQESVESTLKYTIDSGYEYEECGLLEKTMKFIQSSYNYFH